MVKKLLQNTGIIIVISLLLYSFYLDPSWLELCTGLAFFLFGMQIMQDGLTQLAGGKLERILAKSTATPAKSLFFGIFATMILQSTTVVSMLIIAFISANLITLAAGISIIIGANFGANAGIWLLALAGQNLSLSPFAYPIIVIGLLASFAGKTAKSAGRVLIGIAFILLAIDLIRNGFSSFTQDFDILSYDLTGWGGTFILVGIGLVLTIILQSSHATIMLILTMVSLEQITTAQGFAVTIGAMVGSAMATGILGFIGSDRSGMRVAASHMIYSTSTGIIMLLLLKPIIYLIQKTVIATGINPSLEIALFYTFFSITGFLFFWPLKELLANFLERVIPSLPEPKNVVGVTENYSDTEIEIDATQPRFLLENALSSTQTATHAVIQELSYLSRISLEVICHILFLKTDVLSAKEIDEENLNEYSDHEPVDADLLYRKHIKNLYSELLTFISKVEYHESDSQYQHILSTSQIIAFKLVSAVKNSHHLQKNLRYYLLKDQLPAQEFYILLRRYIIHNLRIAYQIHFDQNEMKTDPDIIQSLHTVPLTELIEQSRKFESEFRSNVYTSLRENKINGFTTSSILNDLNYSTQIVESLFNILKIVVIQENNLLQNLDEILQINENEMQ